MAGSAAELSKMGASIVGGHSIEGPRTMIGYTIVGKQVDRPRIKGDLQDGDQLILTKPLGTGVLLAALMQSRLDGYEYPELLESMLLSNEIALQLIKDFEISAITDVTGFGLAGHLAEMLVASNKSARVDVGRIPLLGSCQELISEGIESTLADSNRAVAAKVEITGAEMSDSRIASLFDPQTGGGLLFGISTDQSEQAIAFLSENGFKESVIVGEIEAHSGTRPKLSLEI